MGTLRLRQELLEESFSLHGEALSNFVAIIGYNSYDSSMMCVKLGVHHTRLDQLETARYAFLELVCIKLELI
jgi:hypothetical protein